MTGIVKVAPLFNSSHVSELLSNNATGLNYGHGQVSGYLSDIRLHNLGRDDGGDVATPLFNTKCVLGLLTNSDITESNDDHQEMSCDISCISEETTDDDNYAPRGHPSMSRANDDDPPSMSCANDDDPHHGESTTCTSIIEHDSVPSAGKEHSQCR
jgi:hypothetical protein